MTDEPAKKIIYVEDDPEMIDLVIMILNRRGYQVKGAHGGRQGLDILQDLRPDIILLDLMMPDLDGWDVYHQIKAMDEISNTPVIIITAKAQAIDRVLGLHIAKVDDYISKPFRPQELVDSIERVINRTTPAASS